MSKEQTTFQVSFLWKCSGDYGTYRNVCYVIFVRVVYLFEIADCTCQKIFRTYLDTIFRIVLSPCKMVECFCTNNIRATKTMLLTFKLKVISQTVFFFLEDKRLVVLRVLLFNDYNVNKDRTVRWFQKTSFKWKKYGVPFISRQSH